jgi:hypothetical protein
MIKWHGRVQRVTDGEAHQFGEWDGLLSLLLAMLSNESDPATDDSNPE